MIRDRDRQNEVLEYLDNLIRKQREEAFQAQVRLERGRIENIERAMRCTTCPKTRQRQGKNLARHQYNLGKIIANYMGAR